jgi:uncharacterized Zn finger protein
MEQCADIEIKCPKCRYKYIEHVTFGIKEVSSVCPRCGLPFNSKVKTVNPIPLVEELEEPHTQKEVLPIKVIEKSEPKQVAVVQFPSVRKNTVDIHIPKQYNVIIKRKDKSKKHIKNKYIPSKETIQMIVFGICVLALIVLVIWAFIKWTFWIIVIIIVLGLLVK